MKRNKSLIKGRFFTTEAFMLSFSCIAVFINLLNRILVDNMF